MTLHFPDPTATQRVLADQRRERMQRWAEQAHRHEFGEWTEANVRHLEDSLIQSGAEPLHDVPEQREKPKAEEPREPRAIWVADIQRAVARQYNVSRTDLVSMRRTANVVRPRQVAMYLARVMTTHSLPAIGRRFGKRDHTTVIHAVRKIEALMVSDPELAGRIDAIKGELEQQ